MHGENLKLMENFISNNQERFLTNSAVQSIDARNKNRLHGLFMFAERYTLYYADTTKISNNHAVWSRPRRLARERLIF